MKVNNHISEHFCPDCLGEFCGSRTLDIIELCVGRIPEQNLWLILEAARAGFTEGERLVSNPNS